MRYEGVTEGVFLSRPNRFSAWAEIDGKTVLCHVKNTGRLAELLIPGSAAGFCPSLNPARKTAWDLISVRSGDVWVNVDSQAPNALYAEWAVRSGLPSFRREAVSGDSRFDFLFDDGRFAEVKGVTLLCSGTALFPDAPTVRGEKHLRRLAELARSGVPASVVFVVTHPGAERAAPHPERPGFLLALREAVSSGVRVEAYLCRVTADEAEIVGKLPYSGFPASVPSSDG